MSDVYRLATLKDAEELLDVFIRAYEPIRELGIKFPAATADLSLVHETISNHECYVLERDGKIIATVTVSKPIAMLKDITDFPFIMKFAVEPAYKGQGIGTLLLNWVEDTIVRDTWEAPAVTLGTAVRHPWLVPMYERRGYERIHEVETEDDGTMVLLRKILHPERFQGDKISPPTLSI
ncbi:GNAT family N-acetyltransferase [Paenibacillus selenitireducens]|uniref:GNAT family N-acetyltransferase n=1 Tax=Paenibacillus selenitireducens TaxID=1324314 RepID=A0A1T2X2D5_9BACL|nr:GNAT family N-acetyltransferase [Paenibacillus selenitireducens]OPA73997.1 GNAT family N-acetyltransferase [Paenibacillus selenitireducens]